ncbi:MAG: glycoside hydrolase family 3 C-terminal domain-containing protein [Terriglobia bacterium]
MPTLSNRIRICFMALLVALPVLMLLPAQAGAQKKSPEEIDRQVETLLSNLTLEQKVDLIHGTNGMFNPPMPQIGLPPLKASDGPMGVKSWGPTTAYAIGIGLAASWDTKLAQRVGVSLGHDARARGVNFLLGPGVNIYRAPMNGRNFEYFGEDPYLAGQIAAHYILGVQSQNVVATIKHYAANNSEYHRRLINAIVDERTLREIYLPIFESAVKEGHVGAVMDSYNLINGEHATQNKYLNTDVLKKDWGFRGILMSDWGATHDGIAAANSGLDSEMPSGDFMNAKTLLPAIQEGKVTVETIDDKVRRILRVAVEFGFLNHEQQDLSIPLYNPPSEQVALESSLESMVLLKNQGPLLPLDLSRVHTLAVIGPNAYPAQPTAGGSGNVDAFAPVSFLAGLSNAVGARTKVLWSPGLKNLKQLFQGRGFSTDPQGQHPGLKQEEFDSGSFAGQPDRVSVVASVNHWNNEFVQPTGKTLAVRWTGYYTPQTSGPQLFITAGFTAGYSGDTYQLYVDDKLLLKETPGDGEPQSAEVNLPAGKAVPIRFEYVSQANLIRAGMVALPPAEVLVPNVTKIAALADVAVVTVGFDSSTEGEGHDRTFRLPPGQEVLIKAVAAVNPHTVVVLTAGGSASTSGWLDGVPVLLHTWYAGSQGGNALAQVLFGRANPGGKLPMSWWSREEDDPTFDSYYIAPGSDDSKYTEGVFLGYRAYGLAGRKPQFPFGFGLSYTTFAFSHLSVTPTTASADAAITVSFDVANTGRLAGAEVAQVYVSDPSATVPRPERELKGFERVTLKPGESRHVTVRLNRRSLAYWDVDSHGWKVDPGRFVVRVGDSAENTPLNQEITVK